MELPDPPEGWNLKGLIEIDEGSWSAHYWATDEYVYGYGSTARYAVLDAFRRIEECEVFTRLSGKPPEVDLVEMLNIKPEPMKRRF